MNVASRMASTCTSNSIHVTERTYIRLKDYFQLQKRGEITIKGKGQMTTYYLLGGIQDKYPKCKYESIDDEPM